MADDEPGRKALHLIDKLLRERPEKVGHDFSETTRCLSAYRDRLIARRRAGQDVEAALQNVNVVLSVIHGGHFPLGGVPWHHIEQARARLARVLEPVPAH